MHISRFPRPNVGHPFFLFVTGALIPLMILSVALLRQLSARDPLLLDTNSVDVGAVIAAADPGQAACVRDLRVPSRTNRIELWLGFPAVRHLPVRVFLRLHVAEPSRYTLRWRASLQNLSPGYHPFTVPRRIATDSTASLCLVTPDARLDLGGASVQRLPGRPISTVARHPLTGVDASVRFLSAEPNPPPFLRRLPAALERASLFKNFLLGPAVFVLPMAFLLLSPALCLLLSWNIASGRLRQPQSVALAAFGLAFTFAASWALMKPIFYGPDESEHFAYVQHLAATGHRADPARDSKLPPYSSEQLALMAALHHNSTVLNNTARPRWSEYWETVYRHYAKTHRLKQTDGGGFTESASGHSPLYYALQAIPYRVVRALASLPSTVLALRLVNAIFAAAVAGLAVLTASMLFPHLPLVWWIAGVLVAFQPVYGDVSATINNDTLVNVTAAVALFLMLRLFMHGSSLRFAVVLGAVVTMLPIAKITGFALWPVFAVWIIVFLLRYRRKGVATCAAALSAGAVAALAWCFVISPIAGWGRGALVNVHPVRSGAGTDIQSLSSGFTLLDRADYALQMFIPFVKLRTDRWNDSEGWPLFAIYVRRGWGRFGWLNAGFEDGMVRLIGGGLLVGWGLVLVAGYRWRRWWRTWLPIAMILGGAILSVLLFVSYAYTSSGPRPVLAEQGRYAFPALVALSCGLSAFLLAFGERLRVAAAAFVSTAMPLIGALGWLVALRQWFT